MCLLGTDVPLVTTWHEVWDDYWEEYLGKLAIGGKTVERLTAHIPQHPTAVLGATADNLARIGVARERIEVVPNGIDVDQIQSAPRPTLTPPVRADGGGGGGFDVLFAGRLTKDKRVDVLLDAFDIVAAEFDATLGIIGDGPMADSLRSQAAALDHSEAVTFLGFLDEYEEVLGHMRAARIFASPSIREGFGITLAEAMAADCTVIAGKHRLSAAAEVVGEAGFVVESTPDIRRTPHGSVGRRTPPDTADPASTTVRLGRDCQSG
jgi:glycosyltransferase involved in cell wall biosynthesis